MAIFGNDKSAAATPRTSGGKEPFRYRLYYRLMDFSLIVYMLAIILLVVGEMTELQPAELPPIIFYGVPMIVWPVLYVVTPLLIVAPRIRDEYAEILWKRSIAQLMILTVVIPPLFYSLIWFISIVVLRGDVANWNGYRPDWLLDPIMHEQYRLGTIIEFWLVFAVSFVLLFQLNRWRDSRASNE